jgi:hypothetical protein
LLQGIGSGSLGRSLTIFRWIRNKFEMGGRAFQDFVAVSKVIRKRNSAAGIKMRSGIGGVLLLRKVF